MLRNRKEQTEPKLVGVNRIADPTKLKLGTFQSLQNWIPSKRYKIKKKRGVEALVNEVTLLTPLRCSGCPEGTLPEAQALPVLCCYDNLTGQWSLVAGTAGTISYVNPTDQSFWCTSAEASGFSSGPYPDGAGIKWKLWKNAADCGLTDISSTEAVAFTGHTANIQATQGAQAGCSGHSDEKSYLLHMSSISPTMFDGASSSVVYFGESSGAEPIMLSFPCGIVGPWTKYGTDFYAIISCVGSSDVLLGRWVFPFSDNYEDSTIQLVAGGVTDVGSPIPTIVDYHSVKAMHATANYLYVLCNGSEFTNPAVFRLNKTTFALVDSWDITSSDFDNVVAFHVFSDGLIFLLNDGGAIGSDLQWRIGFLDTTGAGATTTIGDISSPCTISAGASPSNAIGFHYAANNFWIGDDGGNVINIGPLLCPGSNNLWELV